MTKKTKWGKVADEPVTTPDASESRATEDDPLVSLGSYVPRSIRDRLRAQAEREGRKMRFLVERALREFLDRSEG